MCVSSRNTSRCVPASSGRSGSPAWPGRPRRATRISTTSTLHWALAGTPQPKPDEDDDLGQESADDGSSSSSEEPEESPRERRARNRAWNAANRLARRYTTALQDDTLISKLGPTLSAYNAAIFQPPAPATTGTRQHQRRLRDPRPTRNLVIPVGRQHWPRPAGLTSRRGTPSRRASTHRHPRTRKGVSADHRSAVSVKALTWHVGVAALPFPPFPRQSQTRLRERLGPATCHG